MTTPFSRPVSPAQPDLDSYGFSELALFKSYTRESYRSAFGVEAPSFDPARLIKTWFDSMADTSDSDNVSTYKVFQQTNGQWAVKQLVLPSHEAATLNLPGAIEYSKYEVAPTNATYVSDPILLSLRAEAEGLIEEIGLSGVELIDEADSMRYYTVDYRDDPRRIWSFSYKGGLYNVGSLLANRNHFGVGWPGHWEVGSTIRWLADPPAPTGLDDRRAPRPMPVRDLLPNEEVDATLFGGPQIIRTDRQQKKAEASGQFTDADRSLLREILRLLQNAA
jgi:hypothetical protein